MNRNSPMVLSLLVGAFGTALAMAQNVVLNAIEFPKLDGGPADFYIDAKNKALAIDATKTAFRSQWAIAEMPFPGETGTYDIVFYSMYESDGESLYALRVGADSVGAFQNPSAYTGSKLTTPDYTTYKHTFKGVRVAKGAAIKASGMTHSNGKVPENGAFAWSRGRWSKLEFIPASPSGLENAPVGKTPRISLSGRSLIFEGERRGRHTLKLMDLEGRQVSTLDFDFMGSGVIVVPLPGDLPMGAYLAIVTAPLGISGGNRGLERGRPQPSGYFLLRGGSDPD